MGWVILSLICLIGFVTVQISGGVMRGAVAVQGYLDFAHEVLTVAVSGHTDEMVVLLAVGLMIRDGLDHVEDRMANITDVISQR